ECPNAPAVLGGEPAVHFPPHPEGKHGKGDEEDREKGEEEPGPEGHGVSGSKRRVPSQSTVMGGTPRRTIAWARVSTSGTRLAPGGSWRLSQGMSVRGSERTYPVSRPSRRDARSGALSSGMIVRPTPTATRRAARSRAVRSAVGYAIRAPDRKGWGVPGDGGGQAGSGVAGAAARASTRTTWRARASRTPAVAATAADSGGTASTSA